jgi:thymidylate synthase
MQNYLDLMKKIIEEGDDRPDRTGTGTRSLFGQQLRFNLKEGFPAVTTKKLAWKAVVSELLWFIEGSTDERRLCEILHGTRDESKNTIWTANAQAGYWKDKAKFPGDCGRIYGNMWRQWPKQDGTYVDQLIELVEGIKKDPYGRRHILTAWNPGELQNMALPPCHITSQFYVNSKNELSCQLTQRSSDWLLGAPFNIASYSLLTHMLAQVTGLSVGDFVYNIGDCHLYHNHFEQAKIQIGRTLYSLPILQLNHEINDITKFTMSDISLIGYESHGPLSAPMAV